MAARRADATSSRPRPRPPHSQPVAQSITRPNARPPSQSTQLANTAGTAIVTAARVGRLLGRSGWRIAKQLPGVAVVEQQAQRLRQAAAAEMFRLLDMPQQMFGTASPEEQRVMMLVQNSDGDPAPLRTAMTELLHRSAESTGRKGREYLFGTIVSQLVPDEARILAALADRGRFAAVDVVAKQVGRSGTRTVLANASTVAADAGVSEAHNAATYLTRLEGFGLVQFGAPADDLAAEYSRLTADDVVRDARTQIERAKLGSAKLVRKTVTLSPLGREFWAACAPDRAPTASRSN